MGNVHMEASQINYRKGGTKMSVEQALQNSKGGYDYSTTAYDTNSKWIDGRPIYGIIIPLTKTNLGATGTVATGLTNVDIISISGLMTGEDKTDHHIFSKPIPQPSGQISPTTAIDIHYLYADNTLSIKVGNAGLSECTGYIELKYCEKPETPSA